MNILPKKRWHVRTKENIARVRRDEAEAAEKAKEEERRAKLAEKEARTAYLRTRARESKSLENGLEADSCTSVGLAADIYTSAGLEADIYTSSGNINFFKDVEEGTRVSGANKEHEKEKKMEQEDYEKKIGLLTYLGQDSSKCDMSWVSGKSLMETLCTSTGEEDEVGLKHKRQIDPIKEIIKHTNTKIYPKEIQSHRRKNLCRKDKKCKKKKKHNADDPEARKRQKRKRRQSTSSSSEDDEEKAERLSQLRKERLERESRERQREKRLLEGKNPDEEEKQVESLPFKQRYNSQFNPQLAKQNKMTLQAGVKYWLQ